MATFRSKISALIHSQAARAALRVDVQLSGRPSWRVIQAGPIVPRRRVGTLGGAFSGRRVGGRRVGGRRVGGRRSAFQLLAHRADDQVADW